MHCALQDTNMALYLLPFYYNIFGTVSMFKCKYNQVIESKRCNVFYITLV